MTSSKYFKAFSPKIALLRHFYPTMKRTILQLFFLVQTQHLCGIYHHRIYNDSKMIYPITIHHSKFAINIPYLVSHIAKKCRVPFQPNSHST